MYKSINPFAALARKYLQGTYSGCRACSPEYVTFFIFPRHILKLGVYTSYKVYVKYIHLSSANKNAGNRGQQVQRGIKYKIHVLSGSWLTNKWTHRVEWFYFLNCWMEGNHNVGKDQISKVSRVRIFGHWSCLNLKSCDLRVIPRALLS